MGTMIGGTQDRGGGSATSLSGAFGARKYCHRACEITGRTQANILERKPSHLPLELMGHLEKGQWHYGFYPLPARPLERNKAIST